jgi:hypothetical protein
MMPNVAQKSRNVVTNEVMLNQRFGLHNHPKHVAEIVAKSFYTEMRQAGFDTELIIYVTAQIISELSASIQEHANSRLKNVTNESPPPEDHSTALTTCS